MVINEKKLISLLKKSKNVLLIEPYSSKYIPLGLAKIASFVKHNGGKVTFSKTVIIDKFDLICVSTVFTTDSEIVIKTILQSINNIFLSNVPVIVGGILDSFLPDYSLDYKINGFFKDAATLFTTRGCPNKCKYCMVWRMESNEVNIIPSWKDNITKTDREVCLISDNNFLNAPLEFIEEVVHTLNKYNKKVIFNNGVDCKMINKDTAKLLASLKYVRSGFRTAFDRMDQDGHYQRAMELMLENNFKIRGNSYTYVLFNYLDTPQEAYYRGKECWKYKSVPYFMRYRPLNQLTKQNKYIGKYWSYNLIKALGDYNQNYGYNRGDTTFESWNRIELTKEDWEKWYFVKNK